MHNQKNVMPEFSFLMQVFLIDQLNSLYHSAPVEEQTLKVDCLPRK